MKNKKNEILNFGDYIERETDKQITIVTIVCAIAITIIMAIVIIYACKFKANIFEVTQTEYKNVYELQDKSWFIIDRQNNEYVFQTKELGDWDYELKNENDLKNIMETYFINKYNVDTNVAIMQVENIFKNI